MIVIFLADGFEEIEALTPLDILRRSKFDVKLVGLGSTQIRGSSGVEIRCDMEEKDVINNELSCVIFPGGMPGAENLYRSKKVHEVIKYCMDNNKLICAICAAPLILGRIGTLNNKKVCCYPGFEKELKGAHISEDSVCIDGNIITAKGPGVSMDFSFKILDALAGEDVSNKIRKSMQCI